ncbi:MAG: family 20 glycosylhydrolase [Bacteroidota bacterium]
MKLIRHVLITAVCIATIATTGIAQSLVNPAPFVIPALREWHGATGSFALKNKTNLVVDPSFATALLPTAKTFQEDLKLAYPRLQFAVKTGKAASGDIYFTLHPKDSTRNIEGYSLVINEIITIDARRAVGAFWATRTLLQILEQDKNHNAIPKGSCFDYPQYEVRGFVLDCGRKFFTMEFLRNYVKFMSYYKMNDFHIHLNDNGFKDFFGGNWDSTYSAFRLESATYPNLTAKDGSYTKKEFIALQQMAKLYGVNIIPEIDVPAHSLAFSKAVPAIGSKPYGMDHLDLDNPLTYTVIDNVFKEYLSGPNPVFIGKEVHIGTDEYSKKETEKFRAFTDHYIRFVEGYGKKVRMWGALTHAKGTTPVKSENVTMNWWYNGYAEPKEMVKLGYDGISTPDGWLYIVPAAGYYYDYLNTKKLYREWTPSMVGKDTFAFGDPKVRGGSFAVWNDHVGNGITEKDVHHRVFPAMQVLSQKMWGGADTALSYAAFMEQSKKLGEGPGLNMIGKVSAKDSLVLTYSFDKQNGKTETTNIVGFSNANIDAAKQAIQLKGGKSYLQTPLVSIGYGYTISFSIFPSANNADDAVLFSSKDAVVKLKQQSTGNLGFSREGYDYTFNYNVPEELWSHIVITGDNKGTSLYVNGQLVEKLTGAKRTFANGKTTAKVQTLFFPLQFIGDTKNAFKGWLDNLKVFNSILPDDKIQVLATQHVKPFE